MSGSPSLGTATRITLSRSLASSPSPSRRYFLTSRRFRPNFLELLLSASSSSPLLPCATLVCKCHIYVQKRSKISVVLRTSTLRDSSPHISLSPARARVGPGAAPCSALSRHPDLPPRTPATATLAT